jgi:hypothetical protein
MMWYTLPLTRYRSRQIQAQLEQLLELPQVPGVAPAGSGPLECSRHPPMAALAAFRDAQQQPLPQHSG